MNFSIEPSKKSIQSLQSDIQQEIVRVLLQEAQAIHNLVENLPVSACDLVHRIMQTKGKIIFSGIGKSGIVGQKLAATFSGVGIPSIFMHSAECLHGDLGVIQHDDLFIAISKSGSSTELEYIFSFLKNHKIYGVLLCCSGGPLAKRANLVVALPLKQEACALNLAPTSSSTIMIAFGDAVALCVSKLKKFTRNDFARFHPAGTLGKKLLLTIEEVMHLHDVLPLISPDTLFKDLLITITKKKLGMGIVVNSESKLLGVISDGDLRRACNQGPSVFEKTAAEIMTINPKTTTPYTLASEALACMETFNITCLVVIDNQKVVGLVHIHDIIKTGLNG
ncbi:MAG: KpsF/GutQ family sugar-phosphate isomerase [bacterium]